MQININNSVQKTVKVKILWETLGNSQYFNLPTDEERIVYDIVQDKEVGKVLIETLLSLKPGEFHYVNCDDPEYIQRWSICV